MAVSFEYKEKIETAFAPMALYKKFVQDVGGLIPVVLEDGVTGAIKNFTNSSEGPIKCTKKSKDVIDHQRLGYRYSFHERAHDPFNNLLMEEKITYEIKMLAAPNGGSFVRTTGQYCNSGGFLEEFDQAGKEKAAGFSNVVFDYLQALPGL